ncbi:MAG: mandelate racemase/muconate lactonizing enzyme family protein [Saprospiraceae bacterium]
MKRSDFLRALGGLGAGACAMGAAAPLFAAPTPPSADSTHVKITKVQVYPFENAVFVKIETDAGVSGWGEADHDTPLATARLIRDELAGALIDQSPWMSEFFWKRLFYKNEDYGNTGLLPGAIAGLDNALWDLKGRLTGLPVWALLGGCNPEPIPLYASFGRSTEEGIRNADDMARVAAEFAEQGFKAFKCRIQIRILNTDPSPDPTPEIVRAVRKAIGDDAILFVDFNNGYTPAQAITMAKRLYERYDIAMVEEPVSYHDYEGLAQVVAALDIPVAAGEHAWNRWQIRDLIMRGQADVINTDVIKAGGITENRKMAALASAFNRPIMAHNTRPTLMSAATAHLLASLDHVARWQESAGLRPDMNLQPLFANNIDIRNGFLYLPQGPGLGLQPIESEMKKRCLK